MMGMSYIYIYISREEDVQMRPDNIGLKPNLILTAAHEILAE